MHDRWIDSSLAKGTGTATCAGPTLRFPGVLGAKCRPVIVIEQSPCGERETARGVNKFLPFSRYFSCEGIARSALPEILSDRVEKQSRLTLKIHERRLDCILVFEWEKLAGKSDRHELRWLEINWNPTRYHQAARNHWSWKATESQKHDNAIFFVGESQPAQFFSRRF